MLRQASPLIESQMSPCKMCFMYQTGVFSAIQGIKLVKVILGVMNNALVVIPKDRGNYEFKKAWSPCLVIVRGPGVNCKVQSCSCTCMHYVYNYYQRNKHTNIKYLHTCAFIFRELTS